MPDPHSPFSRRQMLQAGSVGFGWLAFQAMAAKLAAAEQNPLAPKRPHFAPKAKHVIFLCMRGAPSHVDTFDHKPQLRLNNGKPGLGRRGEKLLGSLWEFGQHGKSGQWISELFPNVAKHADDLCIINSMATDIPNHPQAVVQMHTGNFQFVRPSLGAWTLYGLGSVNQDLPGFITLAPPTRRVAPAITAAHSCRQFIRGHRSAGSVAAAVARARTPGSRTCPIRISRTRPSGCSST